MVIMDNIVYMLIDQRGYHYDTLKRQRTLEKRIYLTKKDAEVAIELMPVTVKNSKWEIVECLVIPKSKIESLLI